MTPEQDKSVREYVKNLETGKLHRIEDVLHDLLKIGGGYSHGVAVGISAGSSPPRVMNKMITTIKCKACGHAETFEHD